MHWTLEVFWAGKPGTPEWDFLLSLLSSSSECSIGQLLKWRFNIWSPKLQFISKSLEKGKTEKNIRQEKLHICDLEGVWCWEPSGFCFWSPTMPLKVAVRFWIKNWHFLGLNYQRMVSPHWPSFQPLLVLNLWVSVSLGSAASCYSFTPWDQVCPVLGGNSGS